jgi:hypothetical protein
MIGHLLETALKYAARGWHILPLHSPKNGVCSCGKQDCNKAGKHPRTPSGLSDASKDEHQICRWWNRHPDANIGIVTGAKSGLVVIDLDNDGSTSGEKNFAAMARAFGTAPETLTARTGRGKHLFFRHPGISLKNSASRLAPGVDVRADGGYVVAAPSMHRSGTQYEWEDPEAPLAEVPAWLLLHIQGGAGETPRAGDVGDRVSSDDVSIPEGTRNDSLFRIASSLRGQQGMDRETMERILLEYNSLKCKPPLEVAEVRGIIESVCRFPAEIAPKKSGRRLEQNPLYWFAFNTRDFFADQTVQIMEDYQLGWYLRLRVSAWLNGGFLPAEPDKLLKLARARSKEDFQNDSDLVLADYEEVELDGIRKLKDAQMAATYADKLEDWMKKKDAGEARQAMREMQKLSSRQTPSAD